MTKEHTDGRDQEYKLSEFNQKNVGILFEIYTHTLMVSETIRAKIENGEYDSVNAVEVYLDIHEAHAAHARAYDQEAIPSMNMQIRAIFNETTQLREAGAFRTGPAQVGDFYALPAVEVQAVAKDGFEAIEHVLSKADAFDADRKTAVLVVIDMLLTLGHFVKNASGRTNEDFLHYAALRMDRSFTVSETGYRGQFMNDFERKVEDARWIFRDAVDESQMTKTESARFLVEILRSLAQEQQNSDLLASFLDHYGEAYDRLKSVFTAASERSFMYIPQEHREVVTKAIVHLQLAKGQSYSPGGSGRKKASELKSYISYHIKQAEHLLKQLPELGLFRKVCMTLLGGQNQMSNLRSSLQKRIDAEWQRIQDAEAEYYEEQRQIEAAAAVEDEDADWDPEIEAAFLRGLAESEAARKRTEAMIQESRRKYLNGDYD